MAIAPDIERDQGNTGVLHELDLATPLIIGLEIPRLVPADQLGKSAKHRPVLPIV